MKRSHVRAVVVVASVLVAAVGTQWACGGDDAGPEPIVSSRSYQGHESDTDINNFVNEYRDTLGTRLDDCQTCHTGGTFTYVDGGDTASKNPCDFCHLIQHPVTDFVEALPATYRDTLNPYGIAYMDAGRSREALRTIASRDSDGDTFGNATEIDDLKYPGDPTSMPGQPTAPMRTYTMVQLRALPSVEQFQLCNASRQQFDNYAGYKGVRLRDLLSDAGVNPDSGSFTGVTIIAPDGFMQDVSAAQINAAAPAGTFYGGLDTDTLGTDCGFVDYPSPLPAGVASGAPIPGEPWVQLAYERDGGPMEVSTLDTTSGKINGEGPFRLVIPQFTPGAPDRGSRYSPTTCGDTYDFDDTLDHNAGAMVRGVVAIRVNPLPAGVEDFDYRNGGWAFIASSSVVVYGNGVTTTP
jgi:hypothetical protein